MTTPRTPVDRRAAPRLTPEAVALFVLCRQIEDAGQVEERHEEYRAASVALHSALGLKLWETTVLDAKHPVGGGWGYDNARALRRGLEALARA